MKKVFLAVAAMAMLATACTKDDAVSGGNDSLVSFTIDSPELQTRYGEGNEAKVLNYAFYNEDGILEAISAITAEKAVTLNADRKATIQVPLVEGRTYSAIFWASAPDAIAAEVYDVNWTAKTVEMATNLTANDESYDAFYNYTINIDPAKKTHKIELRRPFAQINIATADKTAAANAGFDAAATKVTLKAYNKLQFTVKEIEGVNTPVAEVAGNMVPFTYGWAKNATGTATVGSKTYDMLSMNYVLVDARTLVNVKMEVSEDATNFTAPITREYTTVPVQRNYRTYIVGNLLTTSNDFNIETKPGFEDDDKFGVIDGQTFIRVSSVEEFNAAFADSNYDLIILDADIELSESKTRAADATLTVSADKALTIDLNGKKLSATSTQTGKNYNMFDVRGTLTVKNGTMEYEHKGDNMAWNNFAEIFYVGFNGTLNLDGVTAKNLGGSDMAYVIDMVNAANITVNVDNSTLESTYIPIRVFNNSKTGVNNVTIKNSTLKGKYCFWVQYWLADGRDETTLAKTLKLDIFNTKGEDGNNNTFTFANDKDAPVLYGFNEAVYFDEYGQEILQLIPIEGAEGVALDAEGNYIITADIGMASISALIAADDNNFAGKTIKLDSDVDLTNVKTNGDSFAPIGSTGERDGRNRLICEPFKGTFDGQGHTIKNLYQSGWDMGYEWGQYGSLGLFAELEGATVKNVVVEGHEAQVEGGDISFIAGSATGTCVFEDITIKDSQIGTYNNGCGGIIGWSGAGNYTFKNIKLGSDVVLGGLWGSFDSSIGGIVGQAEPGATYNFENVEINCRIDAYNDCTASYDYYNYRMCGMIIGRCEETTTIDGHNYPDLSKYYLSFNNVIVNYGTWMYYHYCEPTPGLNGGRGMRVEPGYAYDGLPEDFDHTQCVDNHYNCIPFDQLIGGAQLGVKGLKTVDGVTVNYPAAYECELCGNTHNN